MKTRIDEAVEQMQADARALRWAVAFVVLPLFACAVLIAQGLVHRREVPTTHVGVATSCGRVTDVVLLAKDGTIIGRSTLTTSVGACRERLEVVTVPVNAEGAR